MTTRTTRTLLVVVPVASWFLLVGITAGLSADGQPPAGGLFTVSVGMVITGSVIAVILWARDAGKSHVSSELQDARANFSADMATFYQMLSRRIDAIDGPTQPLPRLAAVGSAVVAVTAPLPVVSRVDADVIDMAKRVQSKLTLGADQ